MMAAALRALEDRRFLFGLLALEVLACALDLLLGGAAAVAPEERLNARAAAQLACGHGDALWAMQYRSFCGGCSADAALAAPLFGALGPTALTWKLVPVGLHLIAVGAGAALAARSSAAGRRAAAAFLALMIGAPAFYRELWATGWGNHAESAALTLGAAALLSLSASPRWWGLPAALLGGAAAGLSVWYAWIAAHALPALLACAALAGRRRGLAFVAGVPLGLAPWAAYLADQPQALGPTAGWWTRLSPAPPTELSRWVWGDLVSGGLWPDAGLWGPGAASALWWGALLALALGGAAVSLRRQQGWGEDPVARPFVPLALAGLLLAITFRYDLWSDNYALSAYDPFNLRYRAPLVPLLALGAAALVGRAGRLGGGAAALVALLALVGFGQRVSAWGAPPPSPGLRVFQPDGGPDASVPGGLPPQRDAWQRSRQADLEAAWGFLKEHSDPLPDCRLAHLGELGRRGGLALAASGDEALGGWLSRAWLELPLGSQRRLFAEGVARGLSRRVSSVALEEALAPLDRGLAADSARAAGRQLAERLSDEELARTPLPGLALTGACEQRGAAWVEAATAGGTRALGVSPEADCRDLTGWWTGLSWGWARWVGCGEEDAAALAALGAVDLLEHQLACEILRE
jgi:hypothetical protein